MHYRNDKKKEKEIFGSVPNLRLCIKETRVSNILFFQFRKKAYLTLSSCDRVRNIQPEIQGHPIY